MYNEDVAIRTDGRVLHKMYLVQVKKPDESRYKFDCYKILTSWPGDQVFRPLAKGNCPLVKQ